MIGMDGLLLRASEVGLILPRAGMRIAVECVGECCCVGVLDESSRLVRLRVGFGDDARFVRARLGRVRRWAVPGAGVLRLYGVEWLGYE